MAFLVFVVGVVLGVVVAKNWSRVTEFLSRILG